MKSVNNILKVFLFCSKKERKIEMKMLNLRLYLFVFFFDHFTHNSFRITLVEMNMIMSFAMNQLKENKNSEYRMENIKGSISHTGKHDHLSIQNVSSKISSFIHPSE